MDVHEAVELIQETAVKAAAPVKLEIPHDRENWHYVIDGRIERVGKSPAPRSHEVQSLEDLIHAALWAKELGHTPVVWHHDAAVELVMDDADRIDRTVFRLQQSELFALVSTFSKCEWTHQDFIKLLRIKLNGAVTTLGLIETIRRLESINNSKATSEATHKARGFGSEVESQVFVSSGAELPEFLTIALTVYNNPGERTSGNMQALRFSLEIEPARLTFRLIPYPDELTIALQFAQDTIRRRLLAALEPEEIRVFHGRP